MKINYSDLWRWDGKIDRRTYILWGIILFPIKHLIDRFVAGYIFDRDWRPFNYFIIQDQAIFRLTTDDALFYCVMLLISIPFIWAGVVLTLKRLRDVEFPSWTVVFFFFPFLNLLFFLTLCTFPSRPTDERAESESKFCLFVREKLPHRGLAAAALGILVTIPLAALGVSLSIYSLETYGYGLFVGVPFWMGLFSVLIYGYQHPRTLLGCSLVAMSSVILLGFIIFIFAFEGLICILMAAPLALVLSFFGGLIGYNIQKKKWRGDRFSSTLLLTIFMAPLLMGAEHAIPLTPQIIAIKTHVDIDASSDRVWKNVISFPPLTEPKEFLFRYGISYPTKAEIIGSGVGSIRHCIFSSGTFVEPIEIWDPPHLLKFSVTNQPQPMTELSIYKDIQAPHLDGYFSSTAGQFLITELSNGRIRLEGTTWYKHNIWPTPYWRLWSDFIIHRIHLRVLNHIKNISEEKA